MRGVLSCADSNAGQAQGALNILDKAHLVLALLNLQRFGKFIQCLYSAAPISALIACFLQEVFGALHEGKSFSHLNNNRSNLPKLADHTIAQTNSLS